jgi:hypothetical protein
MNAASCSMAFCPHSVVLNLSLIYLPMLQYSYEFLVAGRYDAILSSFDEIEDFGELGLQFICHWLPTSLRVDFVLVFKNLIT